MSKTRDLVLAAVIIVTIVIMAFVPFLRYTPLGLVNATAVHIPVIIGVTILESKYGAFLGLTFGLTNLWKNTFTPNPTFFVFSSFVTIGQFYGNPGSLVICLVPRILIGAVAYYVYRLFMRTLKDRRDKQGIALFVAGVAGSPTNTFLVMDPIYLLFRGQYASVTSWTAKWVHEVILGIVNMQRVPEAPVAGVIVTAVAGILLKLTPNIRGQRCIGRKTDLY